ncbi:DNA polymerase alpha/epsilon subunit B [Arabidopsis thaliana x Arabidopsis arenosa]|uniref:DNA polymerase alpha subunit B n=1 Tax=Arabidopsis thaliana x Arabidopsis arenosa TaxID=1240361 RepID=A0A8T2BH60_9BRAS|nr:DNA polymerase alpha/epsilon subunit B [Arabidopsis thaliana x Arabidopsis arenosa]
MATDEEIKNEFKRSGFTLVEEDEILKRCVTLCINYSLKPSDLVSSWELYHLNRQLLDQTVKKDEMDGFVLHLQNEQKESIMRTEEAGLHLYSNRDVDMLLDGVQEDTEEIVTTPTNKSQRLHPDPFDSISRSRDYGYSTGKSVGHVTPFGQRIEKFVVKFNVGNVAAYAENGNNNDVENSEDDIIKRVQTSQRCSLKVNGSGPEPGCRFMYDRTEDRFNALENRIVKHADAFAASGLYEEQVDPAVASQRSIFAVGMICCDGEGHLNDKSILLQSSAERTSGQRVPLDLNRLDQFSIFPGQIVGIEGQNPSGHYLTASKLLDSVPLTRAVDMDLPPAKRQNLDQEVLVPTEESCERSEVSFIIASGPFTTSDNLLFEPLNELLAYAKRKPPQLLVLLGPFVDSEHPEIKKGAVDATFSEIFQVEVLRKLQDYVEFMGSEVRVVLVPSIRDANHDFIFPQPPFDIHIPDLEHQMTSLSNPGTFEANQVKVGCCTVDVLKQLSGEEMSKNPSGVPTDRMSRLASHLLRQRSFYPLYPPPESLPYDSSLAPKALQISSIPDILLLPSDMRYFVKILSLGEEENAAKCVCVNPGRLAKGEGAGTFVELTYKGGPESMHASIISI